MVVSIISGVAINPVDFDDEIDNPYLPLRPGSVWVYRGEESLDIVRVTDNTKTILGVETTVVFDVAISDGEVVEKTFDWFAQDEDGNVWYFGEDTKEIEDGRVVSTHGSWEAGVDGAKPGIVMQADPQLGQNYHQEDAPGVAEDQATILSLQAEEEVPFGQFEGVLKTYEHTPLDLSSQETKFYAKGVGHILTIDEPTGEREELVWFTDGGEDFARSDDHAAGGRLFHGSAARWADHFDLA